MGNAVHLRSPICVLTSPNFQCHVFQLVCEGYSLQVRHTVQLLETVTLHSCASMSV